MWSAGPCWCWKTNLQWIPSKFTKKGSKNGENFGNRKFHPESCYLAIQFVHLDILTSFSKPKVQFSPSPWESFHHQLHVPMPPSCRHLITWQFVKISTFEGTIDKAFKTWRMVTVHQNRRGALTNVAFSQPTWSLCLFWWFSYPAKSKCVWQQCSPKDTQFKDIRNM